MRDATAPKMRTASTLALLALVLTTGCHRRYFEGREHVHEVGTTTTTSVDVTPDPVVATPAPAPALAPVPTAMMDPLPAAPSEADRTAQNLGLRDAGESTATPAPVPISRDVQRKSNDEEQPARRVGPPSAADPNAWGGH